MLFDFDHLSYQFFSFQATGTLALLIRLVLAVGIAVLFWAARQLIKHRLLPGLITKSEQRGHDAVTILLRGFEKVLPNLVLGAGFLLALCSLPWAGAAAKLPQLFTLAFRIGVIVSLALGLWRSSDLCGLLLKSAQSRMDMESNQTLITFLTRVYQAVVAAFACITALNEFGFDATSLITGVGLVGLTVSLAAQDSASNLVSGLVILLERPFNIGDWIAVNDIEGTVEDISFRSTKIRALDNSLYVLPNSSVSSATINNGTSRTKRLYRFTLGVTYNTTRAQLEKLMEELEALLKANENLYDDSVTVKLTGFGGSSIDILVSCYARTADLGEFLAIQNALNLDIIDLMNANGVEFAFPSASVYLEKVPQK